MLATPATKHNRNVNTHFVRRPRSGCTVGALSVAGTSTTTRTPAGFPALGVPTGGGDISHFWSSIGRDRPSSAAAPAGQTAPPSRCMRWSRRRSSTSTPAAAEAGPGTARRASACTWACGTPSRAATTATSRLTSRRNCAPARQSAPDAWSRPVAVPPPPGARGDAVAPCAGRPNRAGPGPPRPARATGCLAARGTPDHRRSARRGPAGPRRPVPRAGHGRTRRRSRPARRRPRRLRSGSTSGTSRSSWSSASARGRNDVVAFLLELGRQRQQRAHRWKEHGRRLGACRGPGRRVPRPGRRTAACGRTVIQARQAARGMSTPSDTMRTQTATRSVPVANAPILALAFGSSERISTGSCPVTRATMPA